MQTIECYELIDQDLDCVAGGITSQQYGAMSGVLAIGAGLTRGLALFPGPHTPIAGAVSVVMTIGAAGMAIAASNAGSEG